MLQVLRHICYHGNVIFWFKVEQPRTEHTLDNACKQLSMRTQRAEGCRPSVGSEHLGTIMTQKITEVEHKARPLAMISRIALHS